MVLWWWGLSPWRDGGVERGRLLSVSADGQMEDGMIFVASAFSFGFLSVVRWV